MPGETAYETANVSLAGRRCDVHEFFRKLVDCVEQAVVETRSRKKRADAFDGTGEAIGQDPPDPLGWLLTGRCALELLIGLGTGRRTFVLSVA